MQQFPLSRQQSGKPLRIARVSWRPATSCSAAAGHVQQAEQHWRQKPQTGNGAFTAADGRRLFVKACSGAVAATNEQQMLVFGAGTAAADCLPKLVGSFEVDGRPFLVEEHAGIPLANMWPRDPQLLLATVECFQQVASVGMINADRKPAHSMVRGGRVREIDWGMGVRVGSTHPAFVGAISKAPYLADAPNQVMHGGYQGTPLYSSAPQHAGLTPRLTDDAAAAWLSMLHIIGRPPPGLQALDMLQSFAPPLYSGLAANFVADATLAFTMGGNIVVGAAGTDARQLVFNRDQQLLPGLTGWHLVHELQGLAAAASTPGEATAVGCSYTRLFEVIAKWLRGGGGGAASSASLQLQQPQPQPQRQWMVPKCPSRPPRMQKPAVIAAEEEQQSAAERMRSAQAEEAQRQAVLVGQAALGLPRTPRLVSLRREAQAIGGNGNVDCYGHLAVSAVEFRKQVVQERFLPAVQQRVLATGMALHQTQGLGVFADFLDLGSFHHPDISRVAHIVPPADTQPPDGGWKVLGEVGCSNRLDALAGKALQLERHLTHEHGLLAKKADSMNPVLICNHRVWAAIMVCTQLPDAKQAVERYLNERYLHRVPHLRALSLQRRLLFVHVTTCEAAQLLLGAEAVDESALLSSVTARELDALAAELAERGVQAKAANLRAFALEAQAAAAQAQAAAALEKAAQTAELAMRTDAKLEELASVLSTLLSQHEG